MGVKTMSEYINEYRKANDQVKKLANRLRDIEEKMIGDVQPLL